MDRVQKFEYQQQIEQYMEENQVYELFEQLMKQLVVNKPERPLDFLIEQLKEEPSKRIFLMGPPGCFRQENALFLSEHFGWKCITTGDLLRKEVQKKTQIGKRIQECFKEYHYVDDQIVIDLIKADIESCEEKKQSFIVQGFPRTKVQALALQKMGIISDKFILLKVKPSASLARIKNNLIGINQSLYGPDLEDLANQCLQEYEINMKGVREAFNQFIFEHDCVDKAQADVSNELHRMLKLRFKSNAPRRPPRVIIVGPPGSGKDTQAQMLAAQFGLVHVSAKALLLNEIQKDAERGRIISNAFDTGSEIPDDMINDLVAKRLAQSDCKVSGWVLEGFPTSKNQINLLKSLNIKPSIVFLFEGTEDECVRRLQNRRVDPQTGAVYNLEVSPPGDEATSSRLIEQLKDSEKTVRTRYAAWKKMSPFIEEAFRNQIHAMQCERSMEELADLIADALQSPN